MKQQYFKSSRSNIIGSESGVYVVLISLWIVLLIGVVALAVDISMIALAQVRTGRAADAAVLEGFSHRTFSGWSYFRSSNPAQNPNNPPYNFPAAVASKEQEVSKRAALAAHENLDGRNPPPYNAGVPCPSNRWFCTQSPDGLVRTAVDYNSDRDNIRVIVDLKVPVSFARFFGRIPVCQRTVDDGAGNQIALFNHPTNECHILIDRRSQLNAARVGLVVDTSDSMNCPISGTDCSCLATNSCPYNGSRLESLQRALRNVVAKFNPNTDFFSLIPYNIRAEDPVNNLANPVATFWVRDTAGNFQTFGTQPARNFVTLNGNAVSPQNRYDEIFRRIDSLQATGNTNIVDALHAARRDFQPNGQVGSPYSLILFTDGRPTAATWRPGGVSQSMKNKFGIVGNLRYDPNNLVTQFVINWDNDSNGVQHRVPGPSPLLRADLVQYGKIPTALTSNAPGIQRCGTLESDPSKFHMSMWNAWVTNDLDSDPCVQSFATYRDPYFPDSPGEGRRISSSMSGCVWDASGNKRPDTDHEACLQQWRTASGTPGTGWGPLPFENWQQFLPNTDVNTYDGSGANYNTSDEARTTRYYIQHFHNMTIEASDVIRENRGTIFVVALGVPITPTAGDPYGSLWNSEARNDNFLRRVAHDVFRGCKQRDISFEPKPIPGVWNGRGGWGYLEHVPLFTAASNCSDGNDSNDVMDIRTDGTDGAYTAVDPNWANPAQRLNDAFTGFASDIMMRLD